MRRGAKVMLAAVVLTLAALAGASWPRAPEPAPTPRERPRYTIGEVVSVDAEHHAVVIREGVDAVRRESIAIDPELTVIRYGKKKLTLDAVRPGDHATVRFAPKKRSPAASEHREPSAPRVAAEVRLARGGAEDREALGCGF